MDGKVGKPNAAMAQRTGSTGITRLSKVIYK